MIDMSAAEAGHCVELTAAEYKELLRAECDLETLGDVLKAGARLSYDKSHLCLEAGTADAILHCMLGADGYDAILHCMQERAGETEISE